jgi:hypothetical protein
MKHTQQVVRCMRIQVYTSMTLLARARRVWRDVQRLLD